MKATTGKPLPVPLQKCGTLEDRKPPWVPSTLNGAAIVDSTIKYSNIQDVSATDRILGRDSAGAGVIEEIAPVSLLAMLSGQAGADFSMNTHKITNLLDPTDAQDAATRNYVLTTVGSYVPYSGATGNINLNAVEVTNGTLNAMVLKGTFTASGVVTLPAFTMGGIVSINGQMFSGAAIFDNTVTLPNNTALQFKDAAGNPQVFSYLSPGGTLVIQNNIGVLKMQNGQAHNIAFWNDSEGTGRTLTIGATPATAGGTTRNSPTISLAAKYWNGAASTTFAYIIINTMTATTPASTVTHSINSVSLVDMINTNGVATGILYGQWTYKNIITSDTSVDSVAVADQVSLGGYELSAGHRALAISSEETVTTETVASDTTLQVRINGVTYKFLLRAV
jgi:hypothetical protein